MKICELPTKRLIELKETCEKCNNLCQYCDELVKATYYEEKVIYDFVVAELKLRGVL